MTAEVAIINRGAVTLAADSAMTLRVRGQEKIYTATDKLFELSSCQPIGIMVYNNLEFMGVPFELAIKHFRELNKENPFATVEAASAAFLHYLNSNWMPDEELVKKHTFQVILPIFQEIQNSFNVGVRQALAAAPLPKRGKKKKFPDIGAIFTAAAAEQKAKYESMVSEGDIGSIPFERLEKSFGEVIAAAEATFFDGLPLDEEDHALIRAVAIHALKSSEFSNLLTGLVFAGFGTQEMFPALHAVEIDGVVEGILKQRKIKTFVSTRGDLEAEIIPFAQREMADRFMFGVDPEFEAGLEGFFEGLIKSTGSLIIATSKVGRRKEKLLKEKLDEAVTQSLKSLTEDLIPKAKQKFRQQVEDMVLFMPKAELASLAEALVNITSIKRKYSAEQESVAGPVDVAVISRNDGFVWVKRKHYFDPSLNPRFFSRKYGHH